MCRLLFFTRCPCPNRPFLCFLFFKQKTAYGMRISDWSSDVCSSDLVDRQTGFVQQLKPLDAETISADRALTQSFLVQYVIAREGFDIDALQSDYRKVALWSSGSARQTYLSDIKVSNPDSPLARLPRSSRIDVEVKSGARRDRKSTRLN